MRARAGIVTAALLLLTFSQPPAEEKPLPSSKIEQTEVRLVLIDAVVLDGDGRRCPGLTKEDFALRIDGRNTGIAAFEDHCPARLPAPVISSTSAPPAGEAAPPVPAPRRDDVASVQEGRVVLYFDLPHLTPPGANRSVVAARRYLGSADLSGSKYMVVAYSGEERVLTSFTNDPERLSAALGKVLQKGSSYDDGPLARINNIQLVSHENCREDDPTLDIGGTCPKQRSLARNLAKEEELRAKKSLNALRAAMVSLGSVPGRKSLILFTDTLMDEPGVYYLEIARTTPAAQEISVAAELRAAVEEANGAGVAFYPIYAGGLEDPSMADIGMTVTSLGSDAQAAETANRKASKARGIYSPSTAGKRQMDVDVGPLGKALKSAESAALGFEASIAMETGGRHLGVTNDLSKIFPIVREETSCYYVLSYEPAGPADGKRHTIHVGVNRKGLEARSRQSFTDWGPEQRTERRLQTVMAAPGAFRDLDLKIDAFALGRTKEGRQVLIKASLLAADLLKSASGVPPDDGAAMVRLRGRVTADQSEVCFFGADFPVANVASAAAQGGALHYEAACSLRPGTYDVSAAILESRGGALGGARRSIGVTGLTGYQVSEPQLWASSDGDLVYREQAADVFGSTKGVTPGVATPRAERRLMPGEKGSLFFYVCPSSNGPGAAASVSASQPLVVTRVILSGENPVATFPPLKLTDKPDPQTGCWGVSSEISSKVFGEGVYTFNYDVSAPGMSEPISRSAAFAVGANAGGEAPPSP